MRREASSGNPSRSNMNATSACASPGRSSTSIRSAAICASKISRWLFEDMYSPAPIEKTSASVAAMPLMSTVYVSFDAAATTLTTARMLVTPSCRPNTTSRTSARRFASFRSSSRCVRSQALSSNGRSAVGWRIRRPGPAHRRPLRAAARPASMRSRRPRGSRRCSRGCAGREPRRRCGSRAGIR